MHQDLNLKLASQKVHCIQSGQALNYSVVAKANHLNFEQDKGNQDVQRQDVDQY